ncbi:hypothetical protein ACGFX8_28340 [Streptomyces sp. NPDC048362]|uniref:hypothetical protein n=1 Tax=Streptomyces sp. NPDC048362 TaxID=3365539 RepID=UPI00371949DC
MTEPRHSSRSANRIFRRPTPPPALCGFLLLLALALGVSYAVGSAAGPMMPGLHGTGTVHAGDTGGGSGGGTSGGDPEDMPGMHAGGE